MFLCFRLSSELRIRELAFDDYGCRYGNDGWDAIGIKAHLAAYMGRKRERGRHQVLEIIDQYAIAAQIPIWTIWEYPWKE